MREPSDSLCLETCTNAFKNEKGKWECRDIQLTVVHQKECYCNNYEERQDEQSSIK